MDSDKNQPVSDLKIRKELEKGKRKDREARTFQIRSNMKEKKAVLIEYGELT